MAVFVGGTAERIERLSRASDLLKKHSGNLQNLIHDLQQVVDSPPRRPNSDYVTKELAAEWKDAKWRLVNLTEILDRYTSVLDCERSRLEELIQSNPLEWFK